MYVDSGGTLPRFKEKNKLVYDIYSTDLGSNDYTSSMGCLRMVFNLSGAVLFGSIELFLIGI